MSAVRFRPKAPFDPLAQSVEHLTFNQGVPRSSRGWITIFFYVLHGGVSERFKELVLKTSDSERDRGFESHPLRHNNIEHNWRSTQVAEEAPLLRE